MKTTLKSALVMAAIALLIGGCGGSASAPPVDLPAPITGYIDVSAPDGNGDVTISGGEGSVEGDSIVLVVNESESASIFRPVIDALVRSALAEDGFPEICSRAGHACTMSDSNGEFVLVIKADYGDLLTIGIINSLGEWISELSQMSVPSEPEPGANCSGKSLSGKAMDLVLVPDDGTPILLKQGSDTTTNQLVIGTSSPGTVVDIGGCYAHSLAIHKSSGGTVTLVATSGEDKILWRGIYSSGTITSSKSFTLDYVPMHAAFADSQYEPIVALIKGSSLVLARISLYGGGIVKESAAIAGNPTRSLRVAVQEVAGWLGLVLSDEGPGTNAVLVLFDAITMDSVTTISSLKAQNIFDAAFWIDDTNSVNVALAGNESDTAKAMSGEIASGIAPFTTSDAPSDATSFTIGKYSQVGVGKGSQVRINISNTAKALVPPAAVTTGPAGSVCVFDLINLGKTGDMVCKTIASGHDFAAISLTDDPQYTFVADATDGVALDVSTVVWP